MDLIGDKKSWEQHREAGKFAFLAKDYKAWFKHSIVAAERVSSIDWSIAVEIYRNLGSDAMELKLFAYSAIAYSRAASHFENLALQQAGIFMALSQDANKQARLALKSVKKSSIVFPKSE